jgi:hypothetical protein
MKVNKTILSYVIIGLSLFVLSLGVSYLVFSTFSSGSGTGKPGRFANTKALPSPTKMPKRPTADPSLPRTEVCPINGVKYTMGEKQTWETRRPLAVMIENSYDSRPQSGLSVADVVYEAIAEGGITRFMAVYYCGVAAGGIRVAPVRSARIYFTKIVPEYDALYNHVGGAGVCEDVTVDERAKALCFIRMQRLKDMDQFGLGFKVCHRQTNRLEKEVAFEHTMSCFTDELYAEAAKRNYTNVDAKNVPWDKYFTSWKFKYEPAAELGTTTMISLSYSDDRPQYTVRWDYDKASNAYLRTNGGEPAIDLDTEERLMTKNVVVQYVKGIGPLDEHFHMYYEVVGTGKAQIFMDGKSIKGTWAKKNYQSRTKFFDENNNEITFNAGTVWIHLLPSTRAIEYN